MKINGPTIFAFSVLIISFILALYITDKQFFSYEQKSDDVEIIIKENKKTAVNTIPEVKKSSLIRAVNDLLKENLNHGRKYSFSVIDGYEYEIADGWREVLNIFEYLEYYKAMPEAFIRRLIFMPTFTGNKEYCDEGEEIEKPIVYPDWDYRSFKYRLSLVPDTINSMKSIVDYFYYRIKVILVF